jgi:hypothetical protein
MQREMGGRTHLGFEIPECMGNLFVGEHQSRDMNEGAARESKYDNIRHGRQLLGRWICRQERSESRRGQSIFSPPGPSFSQALFAA